MSLRLDGLRIAILVADGFEESELVQPRKALDEVGALSYIVSPEKDKVRAWSNGNWSNAYTVNVPLYDADYGSFDALLLPGGVINPDTLRLHQQAIDFIQQMGSSGKPIASICHGPWTLINAQLVKGKKLTSWPSIRLDLQNAGAQWTDEQVVVDGNLVTSRKPDDIPHFNQAMIDLCLSVKVKEQIE